MKKILVLCMLMALAASDMQAQTKSWTADNGNGTFTNPLFYDEFSDPDVIRVGDRQRESRDIPLAGLSRP